MARFASPTLSLRRYGAVQESDVHDFHQIVLGVDGAMTMMVDGVDERIDRRSAWLIPAGSRHEYAGLADNSQLVLDLPLGSLAVPERLFERAKTIAIDPGLTALVGELAARVDALSARRLHWQAAARLCGALVGELGGASSMQPAAGLDFARIDRWLRAHLAEPLRIADLAAHCGFGMRRFHQLFCDAFGETPHRYLQRLRLDAAVVLLGDPKRSLADIAGEIGFADQSAFTHAFTKRFGLAPGRWRGGRH
ncbi:MULTISPECIES: helix-turn-helix domain-containing protein [Burkholderia]|uniref:AraC family transcriptional regulator n=1 Tax=Burkholderia savannae TaxID=1637837 RepID=A0ABR5T320_9BURK|nr:MULTISPECIES: AraC family transcriptional regulator [Burkholderia]AOJ73035.1 AraC family transcriptional regulator [Burkholderia savannae]AOJ84434.1 AraC family transcriptional regulator [Burkholderia savannae]AOK49341.1 AraC family transcriptional regulator [Burkholderia sp. MSMB617WGS]KGS02165.1 helix-turn-helix domain protein [Burkholderia sp. ABCPW 111]KVG46965.1 AraC family transcriptional regulator [Burkholderia sp. MSMB0265]